MKYTEDFAPQIGDIIFAKTNAGSYIKTKILGIKGEDIIVKSKGKYWPVHIDNIIYSGQSYWEVFKSFFRHKREDASMA